MVRLLPFSILLSVPLPTCAAVANSGRDRRRTFRVRRIAAPTSLTAVSFTVRLIKRNCERSGEYPLLSSDFWLRRAGRQIARTCSQNQKRHRPGSLKVCPKVATTERSNTLRWPVEKSYRLLL